MKTLMTTWALDRRWTRVRRGNLWQRLEEGTTATVFFRPWEERWAFCVCRGDDDEPYSCLSNYRTERAAAWAAARELASP